MKYFFQYIIFTFLFNSLLIAQGTIKGRVFNSSSNEPVPYASLVDALFHC
jgi:hypothetical protein